MWKCWWKMTKSSPSAAKNRIVIGKVGAPHGIHGELRVAPLTDFPNRFDDLKQVYVGDQLLDIDSMKYHKQFVILRFKQYPVREEAMRLTGQLVSLDRSQAAPLAEGEYYAFDIVGLSVYDMDDRLLGKVTNILKTGSNDVYVVKSAEGTELLVPALKKVVKEIQLAEGRMVVDLLEEE